MAIEFAAQGAQTRQTAEFHPSVWGDFFMTHTFNDEIMVHAWTEQLDLFKQEVKMILKAATDNPSEKLNLINMINLLGIARHFEKEIKEELEYFYNNYRSYNDEDLHSVALLFRLLRQQGYNVPCDVFNKFMDGKGNFKESLINDVQGMLSLYEASYLSMHGEDILDEAFAFTTAHLQSMVTQLSYPVAQQVSHALKWPIHRGILRKNAFDYLSIYEQEKMHNETVLKLGKLEFNIMQHLYQKELSVITEWWLDLDFATKLPFARDRVVECYLVALGSYPDPQYVFSRTLMTKIAAIVTVIDDIYDVYGTIDELELFTKAFERWDIAVEDELPDYMKLCFQAMLDLFSELETQTTKEGRPFCIHYAREAMKNQIRFYMTEAHWFNEEYVPTIEEYMAVATYSISVPLLMVTSLCGIGKFASKEVFDWLFNESKILVAVSSQFRFIDDIMTNKFEQGRGHVASSIECYMKQHGMSRQQAYEEVKKQAISTWKSMNEELLHPIVDVPMIIRISIFNIARVTDLFYKDDDSFTNSISSTKDIVTALLVDSMAV